MTEQANTTELAKRATTELSRTGEFMPVMAIDDALYRYQTVIDFTRKVMKPGRDYGVIPGTERKSEDGMPSSKNNTLLKPGAEKLCTLFGLVPKFVDYRVTEDWDNGMFYYAFRCELYRGEKLMGTGIGSANSREKKYRRESRNCPVCGAAAIKKSKYPPRGMPPGSPGGWYCDKRGGGCGAEFSHDDPAVMEQAAVIDANAAADLVNTLQKMAQKRSLVAATLIATNASEFFTQDLDDVIDGEIVSTHPRDRGAAGYDERADEDAGPDLGDDEVFLDEWYRVMAERQFDRDAARLVLDGGLAKIGKSLNQVNVKGRLALLSRAHSGEYDRLRVQKASESTPAATRPADAGIGWDNFVAAAMVIAQNRQIDEADAKAGIAKAVLGLPGRMKGKEKSIPDATLKQWLAAMEEDRFVWTSGQVLAEQTVEAAS